MEKKLLKNRLLAILKQRKKVMIQRMVIRKTMDQELIKKYSALPEDVKKAIESSDVSQKIQDIGRKYSLHMDQIGALDDEIGAVMTGAIHPDEFVDTIEEKLNIDTDKAISITTDVNLDIFQAIRESLMKMHGPEVQVVEKTPVSAPSDLEATERQDILAEIENPTPTIHPISAADQTIAGPMMPKEMTTDLITGKLSGTVTIPSQKMTVPVENPAQNLPPKPRTYAADPYREAF
jgi:hypothetical protein